jgi:hypothetical protein
MFILGDTSAQSAIKKAIDDVNKKIAKGNTSSSAKKERERISLDGDRDVETAVSTQREEEKKEETHEKTEEQSMNTDYKNLHLFIQRICSIFERVIRYNVVWGSLGLIKREAVYEKSKLFQTRL